MVNPRSQTGRMSKPSPARYRTTNWSDYTARRMKEPWVFADPALGEGGMACVA